MEELDRRITEALRADEAEQFARLEPDLPPWQMVFETFKGRNRWLNILTSFWMLVFFALAVWCAVRFFGAEETRPALTWGLGFLFFITGSAFLKVWWWMEMQTRAVVREIKRVELQLASLARTPDQHRRSAEARQSPAMRSDSPVPPGGEEGAGRDEAEC